MVSRFDQTREGQKEIETDRQTDRQKDRLSYDIIHTDMPRSWKKNEVHATYIG